MSIFARSLALLLSASVFSCATSAVADKVLPKASISLVLRSTGLNDAWSVSSYPSGDTPSAWMIEVYDRRVDVAPDLCESRFSMLEVRGEGARLHITENNSSKKFSLKPCKLAVEDDFALVTGDVNLSEIPKILQYLKAVIECADGCPVWKKVSVERKELLGYLERVDGSSLFSVGRQGNKLTLLFLFSDLQGELLTCYITGYGGLPEGELRVTTQPIE